MRGSMWRAFSSGFGSEELGINKTGESKEDAEYLNISVTAGDLGGCEDG